MKSIGDPLSNIGPFVLAILKQPEKTLPGRSVIAHVEDTTIQQLLKDLETVAGDSFTYKQISLEDFSDLWPIWGVEIGMMLQMWDELRESSWSGEDTILTKADLGLQATRFVSVKDALKAV